MSATVSPVKLIRPCVICSAPFQAGSNRAKYCGQACREESRGRVLCENPACHQEFLRKLDRPLLRTETVHHKNGDRANNDLDNLELRVGRHGPGATHAHCKTCSCFAE